MDRRARSAWWILPRAQDVPLTMAMGLVGDDAVRLVDLAAYLRRDA